MLKRLASIAKLMFLLTTFNVAFGSVQLLPGNTSLFEGETPDGWGWAAETWTGDDAPYAQTRSQIDNQIAKDTNLQTLYKSKKARADNNPNDPISDFAMAYCAYQLAKSQKYSIEDYTGMVNYALDSLLQTNLPRTYNCVRLRFLIQQWIQNKKELKALGERLLAKDPNDYDVAYHYCGILSMSYSADEIRSKAVPYAEWMVQKWPDNPAPYGLLAGAYSNICEVSKIYNTNDVSKCVAAYQQYLSMVPKTYWRRSMIEYRLNYMIRRSKQQSQFNQSTPQ